MSGRGNRQQERVLLTRIADNDDVREINSAIQNTGGPGFYKAMFSAYHLPTIVDTAYLTMVSRIAGHETEDNPNLVEGFVTINDSIPLIPDPYGFEKVLDALKNFIPVSVRLLFINSDIYARMLITTLLYSKTIQCLLLSG
jgi:hypothetical protein